jgi:hypothetical protein
MNKNVKDNSDFTSSATSFTFMLTLQRSFKLRSLSLVVILMDQSMSLRMW